MSELEAKHVDFENDRLQMRAEFRLETDQVNKEQNKVVVLVAEADKV